MAKLMAPNIRIDWYPEGHFADIQNPTVAELNSGYNLSCAIVTGYTLDFTDSNTEDTTTIFDDFTSESFLNHSYEADLQFFLAPRGSNEANEKAYRKAEELFYNAENNTGYLAKRFGFHWDIPYDFEQPRQRVDLFKVKADLPKVVSEDAGPILLNVKYIPQGEATSGAMSGRIRYEWEGAPHNSSSVKILADHEYTYAWAGSTGSSESIKYKDRVEVARNRAINPSYEYNNSTGIILGSAVNSSSRTSVESRVFTGNYSGIYTLVGGGSGNLATTFIQQETSATVGQWIAFSVSAVTTESSRFFSGVVSERSGGSHGKHHFQDKYYPISSSNIRDSRLTFVKQVENVDTDTVRFGISLSDSESSYNFPGTSGYYYLDGWIAAVADTREEALAQITEYFDGDTPNHSGEIVARNLVPNPSFELNSDGVGSSFGLSVNRLGNRSDRVVSGSWHLWPEVSQGDNLIYMYQDVTGLTPGDWLAFKVAITTISGEAARARLRFGFQPSSGGRQYEWISTITDVRGGMHDLEGSWQVPANVSSAWVMVYLYPPSGTYFQGQAAYATDAWVATTAPSQQAALDQVAEYFDGDTSDEYL